MRQRRKGSRECRTVGKIAGGRQQGSTGAGTHHAKTIGVCARSQELLDVGCVAVVRFCRIPELLVQLLLLSLAVQLLLLLLVQLLFVACIPCPLAGSCPAAPIGTAASRGSRGGASSGSAAVRRRPARAAPLLRSLQQRHDRRVSVPLAVEAVGVGARSQEPRDLGRVVFVRRTPELLV